MSDLASAVVETAAALSRCCTVPSKPAAEILQYWVTRVPPQDQADVLHDIAEAVLRAPPSEPGLFNAIAKGRVFDWFKHQRYRQHLSLDTLTAVPAVDPPEQAICVRIDIESFLAELPGEIIKVIERRFSGWPLSPAERQRLARWRKEQKGLN